MTSLLDISKTGFNEIPYKTGHLRFNKSDYRYGRFNQARSTNVLVLSGSEQEVVYLWLPKAIAVFIA
jgi:hypothetical protein